MRLATPIKAAAILACLLAIPTLALTVALPLYDDELGWKMVDGRYFPDGMRTLGNSLWLDCGNISFPVPWSLVPYRILDSWLYDGIDNPLWVRLSGILIALSIVALIAVALQRVFSPTVDRRTVTVGVVGFATLGIFPFMLAMSRPEQLLLPVVAAMALLAAAPNGRPAGAALDWAIGIGIGLLAGAALAGHPKAIFFTPIFALAGILLPRRWGPRIAALGITLLTAFYAYPYWVARAVCPGNTHFQTSLAARSLFLAIKSHQIGKFLAEALAQNPVKLLFVHKIVQRPTYMASWLPDDSSALLVRDLVSYSLIIAFCLFVLAGFVAYLSSLRGFWQARGRDRSGWAIGALWFSTLGSSLTQVTRNDYEATLMVPLFALAALLSLWRSRAQIGRWIGEANTRLATQLWLLALFGFSIASQILLYITFVPELPVWTTPGYIPNQSTSISAFGYSRFPQDILDAAAQCGIRPEDHPRHLVVDLLTYLPFIKSYQPFLVAESHADEVGSVIADVNGAFFRLGSAGAVVSCNVVPPDLAGGFVKTGQFCCHRPYSRPADKPSP